MARNLTPQPATRKGQYLRLALDGPTGAGKTFTALEIATALGERVVVVDTERGSSHLYAGLFEFDVVEWAPPYDPDEFCDAVPQLAADYDVVILDSASHFWNAEGGVLEIVDRAAQKSRGNSYAGWKEGTPAQDRLVDSWLTMNAHVIVTMRSKMEYILVEKKGKMVPEKVGMAPVQRGGVEFEFTIIGDVDLDHAMTVTKSRCDLVADKVYLKGEAPKFAETMLEWMGEAEPFAVAEQLEGISALCDSVIDAALRLEMKRAIAARWGLPSRMTMAEAAEALVWAAERLAEIEAAALETGADDAAAERYLTGGDYADPAEDLNAEDDSFADNG